MATGAAATGSEDGGNEEGVEEEEGRKAERASERTMSDLQIGQVRRRVVSQGVLFSTLATM